MYGHGGLNPQDASGSEPAPDAALGVVVMDQSLVADMKSVFDRHRVPVQVHVGHPFPDLGGILQIDIPTLTIWGPITAFLGAFAAAAGKDAYEGLKAFLKDLRKARGDRVVLVSDGKQRLGLVLKDDLPDEALRALFEVDFTELAGRGVTGWDEATQRWQPGWMPKRRADIRGWFTVPAPDGRQVPWHLSPEPPPDPVRALCGADLGHDPVFDEDPFREMRFPPCWDCVSAAERSRPA